MQDWKYVLDNSVIKSVEDFPTGTIGFVYLITNTVTNKIYIGKKKLFIKRRVNTSNKEMRETRKRKKDYIRESDWQKYFGSSLELKKDIEKYGSDAFERVILKFCRTQYEMTYYETKYQFTFSVLEPDVNSYNYTILGRFYKGRL